MSEWWTYRLSDFLLFSPRTYYRLFELYNAEVWPLQIVMLAAGFVVLLLVWRAPGWSGRAVAAIFAVLWLTVAWAYLLQRYEAINWAARYFAIGFALQAILLAWTGVIRDGLGFGRRDIIGKSGLALLFYALAMHPLIAPLSGRPWTQAEIFGLAPDPTAIATLGILLAAARPRWHLLVLPLASCAISGLTLWTMEQPEAGILAAAAALAVAAATIASCANRRPAAAGSLFPFMGRPGKVPPGGASGSCTPPDG
jgi:Family of unknown function (DUF6064)